MKKKTPVVIITIVLILIGLAVSLLFRDQSQTSRENGNPHTKYWEETESGDCRQISLSLHSCDVDVIQGEKCSIEYSGIPGNAPSVTTKDGNWTVKQRKRFLSFSNDRNNGNLITVTVPENMAPESVKLKTEYGSFTVNGISVSGIDIQTNNGNLVIADCQFTKSMIHVGTGDMQMQNTTFTELNGKVDLGNVVIDSAVNLYDTAMDLDVEMGSVRINGNHQKNKYFQNGSSGTRMFLSVDMGDIDVNWSY